MTSDRVTRILCVADPMGDRAALDRLMDTTSDRTIHATVVVGDLAGTAPRRDAYRSVFKALGAAGRTAYWVPGPSDAPIGEYLREAYNMEIVFPFLHGVHGTGAVSPDAHLIFAGLGGAIDDDPDGSRDEARALRYPRWEAEYRMKLLREFDELESVLLFSAPPAHKGRGTTGSEAVAELINTHRPRLAICPGERGSLTFGRSMAVAPGALGDGHYAIVDLHTREVELEELRVLAR